MTVPYITIAEVREAENKVSELRRRFQRNREDLKYCTGVALRFRATSHGKRRLPDAEGMTYVIETMRSDITPSLVRQAVNVAQQKRRLAESRKVDLWVRQKVKFLKDEPYRVVVATGLLSGAFIILVPLASMFTSTSVYTWLLVGLGAVIMFLLLLLLLLLLLQDTSDNCLESAKKVLKIAEDAAGESELYAANIAQRCRDYLRELLSTADYEVTNAARIAADLRSRYESLEGQFRLLIGGFHNQRVPPKGRWAEAHFVDNLLVPLLELLGWRQEEIRRECSVQLPLTQGQTRGRADVVCFNRHEPWIVIEAKARITGQIGLERARAQGLVYARALKCACFAVAAPEGLWVYHMHRGGDVHEHFQFELLQDKDVEAVLARLQQTLGRHALLAS